MKLQPVRDFLVVEKTKTKEQMSAGGIVLTASSQDDAKIYSGKVLAIGSGTLAADGKVVPLEVKVGDTVFFLKSLSVDLKASDEEYLLIREEHVMCRMQA